ncbi:uncharacterized protein LOC125584196 isoform X9 [Brassica napus]|uniref:uncharacterized protein LOC125584196 isoform X9 n=1 Tax=Brassica napus TaxID=3708 RepID=UPI00207A52FE|nr:uncharacterized protein LOC125584196 isoform X9 [Brassica napus]
MASSSRKDYEIISDPFDPRCVVACFIRLQRQTDKEKLLLERIRGKEDSTSQKYTDQEERSLINEQINWLRNPLQLTTLERGPVLNLLRSRKQICTGIKERLSTASAGLNQVNKNARKILREL